MLVEKQSRILVKVLGYALTAFCGVNSAALCGNIDKTNTIKALTGKSAKAVSTDQQIQIGRGKALFLANQCLDCHLIAGKGCQDGVALDGIIQRRSKRFLIEHLKDPEEHVARNKKAFGDDPNLMSAPNLSRHEIDDVVAYLLSLPANPQSKELGKHR